MISPPPGDGGQMQLAVSGERTVCLHTVHPLLCFWMKPFSLAANVNWVGEGAAFGGFISESRVGGGVRQSESGAEGEGTLFTLIFLGNTSAFKSHT